MNKLNVLQLMLRRKQALSFEQAKHMVHRFAVFVSGVPVGDTDHELTHGDTVQVKDPGCEPSLVAVYVPQDDSEFSRAEMLDMLTPMFYAKVNTWLARGDGVAVYECVAMDSSELGMKRFISYGSPQAQLEVDTPPERMPDIGGLIGWKYQLVGTYKGEAL